MRQDEKDDRKRTRRMRAALTRCVKALHQQQVAHLRIGSAIQGKAEFAWLRQALSPSWKSNEAALKVAEEALER